MKRRDRERGGLGVLGLIALMAVAVRSAVNPKRKTILDASDTNEITDVSWVRYDLLSEDYPNNVGLRGHEAGPDYRATARPSRWTNKFLYF